MPATGGGTAYDVVIVGAGQSGLATAFALLRSQVTNILVLDKAPRDREGPWRTYARMQTLRSPKDYTGPDLDIPSLTYQSYHEARFGKASWQQLDLIPKEVWADYLLWYRDVLELPVLNEREVVDIRPEGGSHCADSVGARAARRRPCSPARSSWRQARRGSAIGRCPNRLRSCRRTCAQ